MDARHLELAAQYCKLYDKPDLLAVLDLPRTVTAEAAAEALKAHRRRMQSMQANPKYKDRATFFIKYAAAIEDVLSDPTGYLTHVASEQESESLPILTMAIDGILVDGTLSDREEAYVRELAANLGISEETCERVLKERVAERQAKRGVEPGPMAGVTNTMSMPIGPDAARTLSDESGPVAVERKKASGPGTGWWDAGFTQLLLEQIPEGTGRMVDVYCRMAWSALTLLPRRPGYSYVGIDRNADRLELARRSIVALSSRATLQHGDPAPLELPDESVDVVLAIRALQTIGDTREVLAEAHRVLVPGGRVIVVEPDGLAEAFYFDGHLVDYNRAFHSLCARVDRQIAAQTADVPTAGRPGIALGPKLAARVQAAGFAVKRVEVHSATNLGTVSLEGLVRRLRNYPRALARANGVDPEGPEVQACRSAAAELLADRGASTEAPGGNVLPLFLCVGVKT
jgi:SAM-dependent methyltransferase